MTGLLGNKDIVDTPEHKALDKFVSGKKKDLDSAVNDFCDPIETQAESSKDPDEIEALLWRAWQSVTAVAAKTHDSDVRQKLVTVINSIRQRADVQSGGEALKIWDAVVWQDLPVFGAQLREAWNYAATDSSSKEEQTAWLNLNYFAATLVSSSQDAEELSLFGLWTIRTALEEQSDKPDSVAVSAAALWLTRAGSLFRDLSAQEKTFDGKVAKPGSLYGNESWRGFTGDRWKAWKQRLVEVRDQGLGEDAGEMVERAVDATKSL